MHNKIIVPFEARVMVVSPLLASSDPHFPGPLVGVSTFHILYSISEIDHAIE